MGSDPIATGRCQGLALTTSCQRDNGDVAVRNDAHIIAAFLEDVPAEAPAAGDAVNDATIIHAFLANLCPGEGRTSTFIPFGIARPTCDATRLSSVGNQAAHAVEDEPVPLPANLAVANSNPAVASNKTPFFHAEASAPTLLAQEGAMATTRSILNVLETYQKSRLSFVEEILELASKSQNAEIMHAASVIGILQPLLLDSVPAVQQSAALALSHLTNHSNDPVATSAHDNRAPPVAKPVAAPRLAASLLCTRAEPTAPIARAPLHPPVAASLRSLCVLDAANEDSIPMAFLGANAAAEYDVTALVAVAVDSPAPIAAAAPATVPADAHIAINAAMPAYTPPCSPHTVEKLYEGTQSRPSSYPAMHDADGDDDVSIINNFLEIFLNELMVAVASSTKKSQFLLMAFSKAHISCDKVFHVQSQLLVDHATLQIEAPKAPHGLTYQADQTLPHSIANEPRSPITSTATSSVTAEGVTPGSHHAAHSTCHALTTLIFDPGGQANDLSRINNQLHRPYILSSTTAHTYHLEFVFSFRLRGRVCGVQAPEIIHAADVTMSFKVRSKQRSELLISYMAKWTLDPG